MVAYRNSKVATIMKGREKILHEFMFRINPPDSKFFAWRYNPNTLSAMRLILDGSQGVYNSKGKSGIHPSLSLLHYGFLMIAAFMYQMPL